MTSGVQRGGGGSCQWWHGALRGLPAAGRGLEQAKRLVSGWEVCPHSQPRRQVHRRKVYGAATCVGRWGGSVSPASALPKRTRGDAMMGASFDRVSHRSSMEVPIATWQAWSTAGGL